MARKVVKVPDGKPEQLAYFQVCTLCFFTINSEGRPKPPPTIFALLIQPFYALNLVAKLRHDLVQMNEQLDCGLRIVISPETYEVANAI